MVCFVILIIIFNLLSCSPDKSFEGKVIYINSFTPLNKNITEDYLKDRYGDTVIISIKDAYYKHYYNSKNKDGIKCLTYDPIKNRAYIEYNGVDTLIWYNCNSTPRKLFNIKEDTIVENILNYQCNKITFESAFQRDNINYNISTSFLYNKSHYIDPSLYADHGEGFLNLYFKRAEAIYLEYIYTEHEAFERRQRAVQIIHKELEMSEFYIDTTLLKPIF